MDNKKFIASTAEIFTLSLAFICALNFALRGESEQLSQVSELFALCGKGISFTALGELLLLAALISAARVVWFSDRFFQNMLLYVRIPLMLVSVFVMAGVCSVVFHWFPAHMWQAWLGFAVSFLLGTAVSFGVMLLRSRLASKAYEDKLDQYRASGDEEETQNDNCEA